MKMNELECMRERSGKGQLGCIMGEIYVRREDVQAENVYKVISVIVLKQSDGSLGEERHPRIRRVILLKLPP